MLIEFPAGPASCKACSKQLTCSRFSQQLGGGWRFWRGTSTCGRHAPRVLSCTAAVSHNLTCSFVYSGLFIHTSQLFQFFQIYVFFPFFFPFVIFGSITNLIDSNVKKFYGLYSKLIIIFNIFYFVSVLLIFQKTWSLLSNLQYIVFINNFHSDFNSS